MAANVGFFEYPSKHEMKPFRCSFMDGVMLRGFLLRGFGFATSGGFNVLYFSPSLVECISLSESCFFSARIL